MLSTSPDGKHVATATAWSRGRVEIYDTKNLEQTAKITLPTRAKIQSIAWHPRLPIVACGTSKDLVVLCDVESEEAVELEGHTDDVTAVAWSPDGAKLASADRDDVIRIWDLKTKQQVQDFAAKSRVNTLAFHPDGELLSGADWSSGPPILVWDIEEGKVTGGLTTDGSPISLAITPDGKRVYSGCSKSLQEFDFSQKTKKPWALRKF